jgi:predicted RNA-binding Zn-ribbon protein involved in translation (DUF1610 family)
MTQNGSMLDGNAAAGRLADVFVFDITTARSTCAGCGATTMLAEHRAYLDAPGTILRCPSCGQAIVRLSQTPGRTWLDMRGAALWEIPLPDTP